MKREQRQPISAPVSAFPIVRWPGLMTTVLAELDRRNGRAAQRWWDAECNRLAAQLRAAGVAADAVTSELARLAIAIQQHRLQSRRKKDHA